MGSFTYAFESEYFTKLLSTIFSDLVYGQRIITIIDPSKTENIVYKSILSCLKLFYIKYKALPSIVVLKQHLQELYWAGKIKETDYNDCIRQIKVAIVTEPLTQNEVISTLPRLIHKVAFSDALDASLNCLASDRFDDITQLVNDAYKLPKTLEIENLEKPLFSIRNQHARSVVLGEANIERYPTGILDLDRKLRGGLGRGELGVVMAGQKVGKSYFLSHIAAASVLCGLNVIYFTLETMKPVIEARINANMTGLKVNDIVKGGLGIGTEISQKLSILHSNTKGDLVVVFFPPGTVRTKDLELYILEQNKINSFIPDIIIVDYADEMAGIGKSDDSSSNYHRLGNIYTELKALGSICPKPAVVWTASQIKRQSIGSEIVDYTSIADSILKVSKMDLGLAICQTPVEKAERMLRIHIAASRFCAGGSSEDIVGPYYEDYVHGRLVNLSSVERVSAKYWPNVKYIESLMDNHKIERRRYLLDRNISSRNIKKYGIL